MPPPGDQGPGVCRDGELGARPDHPPPIGGCSLTSECTFSHLVILSQCHDLRVNRKEHLENIDIVCISLSIQQFNLYEYQ